MEVTEFGMATLARLVQPRKALLPMEVTEFGIVTFARLVQPRKAEWPMEVIRDTVGELGTAVLIDASGVF